MTWKKALLFILVLGFAFVMMLAAAVGLTVATGVAAVVESGVAEAVVNSVEEVAVDAERLEVTVDVPRVTVTDPDSGRARIIVPNLERRFERFEINGPRSFDFSGHYVFAPINFVFRTFTTLLALGLVGLGVWFLVRNRPPTEKKIVDES